MDNEYRNPNANENQAGDEASQYQPPVTQRNTGNAPSGMTPGDATSSLRNKQGLPPNQGGAPRGSQPTQSTGPDQEMVEQEEGRQVTKQSHVQAIHQGLQVAQENNLHTLDALISQVGQGQAISAEQLQGLRASAEGISKLFGELPDPV